MMTWTTFDVLTILAGLCGMIMVIGSMVLLYKGVITLSGITPEEALSVQFTNMIKVTTHYPSLALFVIGLIFIIVAQMNAKPNQVALWIKGNVSGADADTVTMLVSVATVPTHVMPDGSVVGTLRLSQYPLKIEIDAPGHNPWTTWVDPSENKSGAIRLGEVRFTDKLAQRPQFDRGKIESVALPPVSQAGTLK